MKRIWIAGAAGHVGSALIPLLDCRRYEIVATDYDEVDITDMASVHAYCVVRRPEVIINCAGMTNLAACEADPDRAYLVNALGARNLAQQAQSIDAKLIQLSTDDVFSQNSGTPYNEFDPVHPVSVYGKSKEAGERIVRALLHRYVILRSSWVYGVGNDFLHDILKAAARGGTLDVPVDEYACPTSARELAGVVLQFIEGEVYGTYHAVCKGACSRYEFAQEILDTAGKTDALTLRPIEGSSAGRPRYAVLDNLMLRISGLREPTDWKTALKTYIAQMGGIV